MRYRYPLYFLLFLLSLSLPALGSASLNDIWVSTIESRGGLRALLEFRADGTVATTRAVMLEYKYKLDGSTLVLTPQSEDKTVKDTKYVIKIDVDMLQMKESGCEDCLMTLKRIAGDPQKEIGIVGKWSFTKPSGETVYYIFTTDNHVFFRIPMPGTTISEYKVNGDTIELRRDKEITTMKISVTDDLLILRTQDNKEYRYKRMPRFH
ncbi:MAG: hypothetical protein M0042_09685 [Nitrospiraceae bacterium]|nr:hypothetical protein [Nitrospiraceae bacterium]